jgi:hypothetical protein
VRGPYHRSVSKDELDKLKMMLKQDSILINGVGLFENTVEHVVYFKIVSDNLRKIWRKPDYPIKEFGFNPHISIYKGRDRTLARGIYRFLKGEQLAILCHKFRLSTYVSKQGYLFSDNDISSNQTFFELSKLKRVRPDILERARNLIVNYRKTQSNNSLNKKSLSHKALKS